jgi:hypothetical protein
VQALVLLHSQFLWHGSQQLRQQVRDDVRALANVTRSASLFQPLSHNNPNASALHQPGPVTGEEVNSWNWSVWIENEKRARLTAYIYLIDASSTIFFNTQPRYDVNNITVPLPADDAAWEARTSEDCASALGLRGPSAQTSNESGSRRAKQLALSEALCVLNGACPGQFPDRATNVFGKFSTSSQIYSNLAHKLTRIPSSHTCDSCTTLPHPTAALTSSIFKRRKYTPITRRQSCHTTKWCQRTSTKPTSIDSRCSQALEDMLGHGPRYSISTEPTSTWILPGRHSLFLPRTGFPSAISA